ncbi:MAG: iron ABC transporter permease [Pseudomonadota bacterium]|nr:iron ABC transporter permease [Pseudomonadota bacterium]
MTMRRTLLLLAAALPLLFALELASGPATIELGAAFADWFAGRVTSGSIILSEVRVPRALLALLVGASLALSGAALQGLLRNPLASPDILGVSQAAGLCAVLVLYYGLARLWFVLPLAALAGALLAVMLMLRLARYVAGTHTIILAGIAISALAGSFIALALNFAPNPYALQEIFYWMLGSVANRSMNEVWLALPFMLAGWILVLRSGRFLDALSLGDATAQSLGFAPRRHQWLLIVGVACCIGASVAVSGNIGFIGLVVPHLLRPLAGAEPRRLLWLSLPGGAALLLCADVLVQALPGAQELQLGVITAALGGPFFLYLLMKRRQYFV